MLAAFELPRLTRAAIALTPAPSRALARAAALDQLQPISPAEHMPEKLAAVIEPDSVRALEPGHPTH